MPTKPEDHKQKTVKPEVVTITLGEGDAAREVPGKRVTVDGVTVDVPDEALDDFETLDDIRAVQDQKDASRLPSLLRRIVGDDYRKVIEQLRDPVTGRVTVERGSQFVLGLFEAVAPN